MRFLRWLSTSTVLLTFLAASGDGSAFDGWHLESVTPVPGQGSSWDYLSLDEARKRLFIGHRAEGLKVFDIATGKVIKVIDGTVQQSSNGATLIPEFDLGLSNNQDGTITPFSMSTLAAMAPIKLGGEIDTSHYDPLTKRVVVNMVEGKSSTNLIVLQAPTLAVVGKIHVPTGKPEHAESDLKGSFYLTGRDVDKVFRLDLDQLKVTAAWPATGCGQTNGLAIDLANDRLFLGCRGRGDLKPALAVMNAATGAVVYTSEIGGGNDGVIYDRRLKRIFLSNGVNAVLNVFAQIDADTYRPVESLGTRASVRTFAMDAGTRKIYSFAAEGSADHAKKITTSVAPFYANTFFPGTYAVLTFSQD